MVSVEELQKVVTDITREKVNPKEKPSIIPSITNVQPLVQTKVDTSTEVDTSVKIDTVEKKTEEEDTTIGQQ